MKPVLPEAAIDLLIDHDSRRQTTRAYTTYGLKRKKAIFSRASFLDSQLPLELLQDVLPTSNMTCRAETYCDPVLAARFQAESFIKRRHVIDLLQRYLERIGDPFKSLEGQIPELPLHVLKDADKLCPFTAGPPDNLVDLL